LEIEEKDGGESSDGSDVDFDLDDMGGY